jgi:predicted ATPase
VRRVDRSSPLLGRKKELADLLQLVRRDGARLVTLTGPAGIGKTRLALELVAELAGSAQLFDALEAGGSAAADVAALLRGVPDAVAVVTSREPLGLAGEREYRLRPLAEAPAVELFRLHAEADDPGFDASYADLAVLCRRLGGLPLAIELAAARAKTLGVDGLLAEAQPI